MQSSGRTLRFSWRSLKPFWAVNAEPMPNGVKEGVGKATTGRKTGHMGYAAGKNLVLFLQNF